MEALLQDIRYAIRTLFKRPWFAVIAITTLALGIGANTAIFTLVNAVMLKTLPVNKPEELVLFSDATNEGTSIDDAPRTGRWRRFSYASYEYFRRHNQSFQDITAIRSGDSRLSVRKTGAQSGEPAQRAAAQLVSGNYFSVLGVSAMRGRTLAPEDDVRSAPPTAVISYKYWQEQLNGDAEIVGKDFVLNGTKFTVVGVMPAEFFGERMRRPPDFWVPLSFQPPIELRDSFLETPQAYWLMLMGRLKNDVSIPQAQATINLALQQFLTEQAGTQLSDDHRRSIQGTYVELVSGAGGISGLRTRYSTPLRMLMAMVALVLLIACANVGSLLLSRATSRNAEISLRMALGASRVRIVRQLLTESFLLAVFGGLLGVALSIWGVMLLVRLVAREAPLDTKPDLIVLGFTGAVSIISGLLFGLIPAIRASKTDLASAMKEKARTGSGRLRLNLSSSLVVLQVSLSMILLTGAGLFAGSLLQLQRENLGFDRNNVLVVDIDPRLAGYKPKELPSLYQRLLDRLNAVPNVRSATMATYPPFGGSSRTSSIKVPGFTATTDENLLIEDTLTSPHYAQTLGMPLLQGREIGPQDTTASHRIAVVNQSFINRYFQDQNPIGRTFSFDDIEQQSGPIEIVGVIGDVKSADPRESPRPTVYRPILQIEDPSAYAVTIHVRTQGDASALAPSVRQAINEIDSTLPIFEVTTLDDSFNRNLRQEHLITQLVSFFGGLALLLASIGLYGLMAHAVTRRTNEIGIRVALGAQRRTVAWLVLRESLLLVLAGLVLGVPAAIFAARLISSQLFGVTPTDVTTLIGAGLVLTVVALVAACVPARRAMKVDPLVALRYE
ncbi:MAG TPA: ABC transporter permease [Pyrinomonadaceae bacterium]|nr:ABC transporter permease [Pyrinomonadaceae bacterium]